MRWRSFVGIAFGFAVVFGLVSSTNPSLPAGFLSAYHWQSDDPLFGGISALSVSADGGHLFAITDKSAYLSAQIMRDTVGNIVDIQTNPLKRLRDKAGREYTPYRGDTEGLAIAADGTLFVSFEQYARVTKFASPSSLGVLLPRPAAFFAMHQNAALESLAITKDGALLAVPERPIANAEFFTVYRFQNGIWDEPYTIPRRGYFLAVDAAIGPDDRLYLLERQFYGLAGFASRVRRFTLNPNQLGGEETLLQTTPGQHDNLEGLSVWRDPTGALRLTMVADNNFWFLQRTEVVEYRVPD